MLAWSGVYAEGHRNGAWRKVEVLNLATLWAAGEMALLRFSPCCKDCTFGVLDASCIGAFHYFELLDHCISKENYGVPSAKVNTLIIYTSDKLGREGISNLVLQLQKIPSPQMIKYCSLKPENQVEKSGQRKFPI